MITTRQGRTALGVLVILADVVLAIWLHGVNGAPVTVPAVMLHAILLVSGMANIYQLNRVTDSVAKLIRAWRGKGD